jgi:hypothetical protein
VCFGSKRSDSAFAKHPVRKRTRRVRGRGLLLAMLHEVPCKGGVLREGMMPVLCEAEEMWSLTAPFSPLPLRFRGAARWGERGVIERPKDFREYEMHCILDTLSNFPPVVPPTRPKVELWDAT